MSAELSTCALCPRLCRPACPVTTGTGREAAVPTFLAGMAIEFRRGRIEASLAEAALSLCTDCGACEEHCHIHHPLPELLRQARQEVAVDRLAEPLRPIDGDARRVAIEADDRPLGDVVEKLSGERVARWKTADRLGIGAIDSPAIWSERKPALRNWAEGRELVVADGGVAKALESAGVAFTWLSELADSDGCTGSCAAGGERPLACCGGGGPLADHHPEDAARLARAFARRWDGARLVDARCREHLRNSGIDASDLLDQLVEAL
ncbi:MAG: 4Fe-4S dicluster domain-containing protein [Proteobacteria bacterium]|nr:4Fe-4S dicluster domain-containing protein [Pseudomonadota bacterium]